jgi:hypothetical protein
LVRVIHHEDRIFHIGYIEKSIFTDPGYIEHIGVILSIFGLFKDTLLGPCGVLVSTIIVSFHFTALEIFARRRIFFPHRFFDVRMTKDFRSANPPLQSEPFLAFKILPLPPIL